MKTYPLAFRLSLAVLGWLLLPIAIYGQPAAKIDFAHDVAPILKARCAECHTNGKYKGGVNLDSRAMLLKSKAAVPGKSASSKLLERISNKDPQERMPPKGEPLSAKQIDILKNWIDQGLAWEEGFTFRTPTYVAPLKPRRPTLPPARSGLEHPIDRIVDVYFSRNKVAWPELLDDTAFLRRVYLGLIGLLPTRTETAQFQAEQKSDKRAAVIGRLLQERRPVAEHWLSFWNDLLRNDYVGTGYVDGGRQQITPWLYRSLLENKPYDQFVRELINPTRESEGFIRGIRWRGNVNASQVTELQFAQNISQVFFGVNLKCASCHDSFIDTWKLKDAYSLAAVVADKKLEIYRCDKATGEFAEARFPWPEFGSIDATQPKAKRLEQLAKLVTHPENGRFSRTITNRIWQRLVGRGIVHPVDIMANKPWSEDLLDYLASYFVDHSYDQKKLIEHIVTSRIYQSRAVALVQEPVGEEHVFRGPELRRMTAEQFLDALWMITRTGPAKADAPVKLADFAETTPAERRLVRAALMRSDALMRSLGRPNRDQVVTTRPDQLTTLQALDLANGQILADTLAKGADRLLKAQAKAGADTVAEDIYIQALCRRPTPDELATARSLTGSPITADGLADLLWVVVMLPEFQLIR